MKVYVIFVKDGAGNRYIDSMWARLAAAQTRHDEIVLSMQAMKFPGSPAIVPLSVADVEIPEHVEAPGDEVK